MIDKEIIKIAQMAIKEGTPQSKEVARQLKGIVLRWYPGNVSLLNKVLPELSTIPRREVAEGEPRFTVWKSGEFKQTEQKKTVAEIATPSPDEEVSIKDATNEELDAHFKNFGEVKQYARKIGLTVSRGTKKKELYNLIREHSV